MSMHERKTIDLEQGWEFMQKGITKLKNILEGLPEQQFSSEDYMMLYTTGNRLRSISLPWWMTSRACIGFFAKYLMAWILFLKYLSRLFSFIKAEKRDVVGLQEQVDCSSSAELLATFCDNILKKGGSEKLSDEAIEETLEKKLARRLLFDKSANDDHERSILTKLKQQCGGQFTSKMEGMVKCVEVFREFYQTKTKHRKLTWIYSLGTCNIIGKFESKTIELIVTTYQVAADLLYLFM
ncbi:hypothetical protein BHE74_00024600 [Ensete ventricosum]|nr:hypothetical protein BHE74_00024600 [Ensete ventricosum]